MIALGRSPRLSQPQFTQFLLERFPERFGIETRHDTREGYSTLRGRLYYRTYSPGA